MRRIALRRVMARQYALAASLPLVLVVLSWVAMVLPETAQRVEQENAQAAMLMRSQVEAVLSAPQRSVQLAASLIAAAPDTAPQAQTVIHQVLATTVAVEALYVADERGIVQQAAVSSDAGVRASDLLGLDLSARPFYALARTRGEAVWSDSFVSALTGRVTAVLAVPLGGRLLVADMSLAGLARELQAVQRLPDAQIAVFDGKGRAIVHPQRELARWQENMSHLPLVRAALAGKPASGEITLGGERWLANVAAVQPTGWYVMVAQPRSIVLAPLRRLAWIVGIALVIGLSFAAALALRFARNVAQRYQMLVSAAQAMVDDPSHEQEVDFRTEETHALWEKLRALLDRVQEQEQRARSAQAELQAVLDSATEVAVISTDLHGVIQLFNRGAEKLVGYAAADVVGRMTPEPMFDAAEITARAQALEHTVGRPVHRMQAFVHTARDIGYEVLDWTCVRKDGSRVLVSMAMTALRDANGQLTGFLATAVDQTQRLRAADLELAREKAEAASRAKTEFLSRVSHELRTPLNAMLGYAQLLAMNAEHTLTATQRERVARIESAGWHLVHLIDDVLDLSRIEAGRMQLDIQPVDLSDVIADAVRMVAPQAAAQGIAIEQHTDQGPDGPAPMVHGDRTRLKQVLVNLLSNAVKYNMRGGSVSVTLARAGDSELNLSVSDTGRGMDEGQLQRLFEPFDRLGLERTDIEGTGIGLVITRRLLEMMSGRIAVKSRPGKGSNFTVTLPRAERDLTANETTQDSLGLADEGLVGEVVYVEDNPVNAELMNEVFALRPGCRLHVAGTLAAGREMIDRLRPRLVLVDLHLPDGSGISLIEWLQEHPVRRDIPAIVVSADATHAQHQAAMQAGARAYLHKPIRVAEALTLIDDALEAANSTASASR